MFFIYLFIYLFTFLKVWGLKLIKNDTKDIYNVTKEGPRRKYTPICVKRTEFAHGLS